MAAISTLSSLFRARLHIGYLAFPYAILGFFLHFSRFGFDLNFLLSEDPLAFIRILLSILIAFIYMPYLFVLNDFFDAPYDKLDPKKKERNPFCDDKFRKQPGVLFIIFFPALLTLIFGFLISREAGITTIIALVLGTFYSAPPLRFKERPIADFIVHGFCLGVYFFSLGFYSIYLTKNPYILPVFWIVIVLSFADGAWIHLDSAFVDYYTDKKGGQKTTVVFLTPEKASYILIALLLVILSLPSLFFLSSLDFKSEFELISKIFALLFLGLPLSYLIFIYRHRDHFEKIREISSRFRVYTVYTFTIMVVLLSNSLIHTY